MSRKARRGAGLLLYPLLLLTCFSSPQRAWGFATWRGEAASLEIRGFGRLAGGYLHFYGDPAVQERDDDSWSGAFRVLADGTVGGRVDFSANLLEEASSVMVTPLGKPALDVERSALLTRRQRSTDEYLAQLSLDHLVCTWRSSRLDVSIGRQPVNLATTFFFTPNDFFAPFAAQTFFRTYKAGVDAARAEIRFGDLTQLTLLGVLSYDQDPSSDTGWSRAPDWRRTSLLARMVTSSLGFEWGMLAGTVHDRTVVGGSLQGELWDWLGLRAEGHYGSQEEGEGRDAAEFCLGLEHRFPGSLDLQAEYFYHGQGYSSMDQANQALLAGATPDGYLGKNYSALSASYEFSPLLTGQALLLVNWTDCSRLWSLYGVYSLSDESELTTTISIPDGDSPERGVPTSEFGAAPMTVSLEYRLYF